MPPNFGVKYPFYFEINPCHDYAAERSSHHCHLASRAGGEQNSLLCPSPFTSPSTQRESADSPSVFLPICPSIRPRSKSRTGARNRFIFSILGYKSPHRHCSLLIGQSFLCLLLPQAQKTLASSPSSEQMASNKRPGEGSSGAPPPLRPRLG